MKTIFETAKRVVTIVVTTQKCVEGEYVITPTLVYIKEKPCKKSFVLGWLKGYVEIEWTTEKLAQKD